MTFLAVDLKKTITPDLADDIVKQGAYISPDIVLYESRRKCVALRSAFRR